jgi:hypothetical protein
MARRLLSATRPQVIVSTAMVSEPQMSAFCRTRAPAQERLVYQEAPHIGRKKP